MLVNFDCSTMWVKDSRYLVLVIEMVELQVRNDVDK